MRVTRLVFKEIGFRKFNFVLALVAVALPVAVLVGSVGLFGRYEEDHDALMATSADAQEERWGSYQDSMRVTMKGLGFNLLIIPRERTPSDPEGEMVVMPEGHATRLAESDLQLVNHVLPFLERRVFWEERGRWVHLFGTPGEVYIKAVWQKPIQEEVARGTVALGYNVHHELGIRKGDTIKFHGKEFVVGTCYPRQAVEDDERVWMHLGEVQGFLGESGKISGMMALSCDCADKDLPLIATAVHGVLPGTKVLAETSAMSTRHKVRGAAADKEETELAEQAREHRTMRNQRAKLARNLLPWVLVGSFLSVSLLSWLNVRERRQEIGIFRAIGYARSTIVAIFLGKALLVGLLGAVAGSLAGAAVVTVRGGWAGQNEWAGLAGLALLGAPVLAVVAALLPAVAAAGQDPVDALREE
jgi:hypothetical protein